MPCAARKLRGIGSGVEHGKHCRARPTKQRGADLFSAQQPLLEFCKKAVLGKDRTLEVVDQFQTIDDLRRVANAGDFMRIEPMPIGLGRGDAEGWLEQKDRHGGWRLDRLEAFAAATDAHGRIAKKEWHI